MSSPSRNNRTRTDPSSREEIQNRHNRSEGARNRPNSSEAEGTESTPSSNRTLDLPVYVPISEEGTQNPPSRRNEGTRSRVTSSEGEGTESAPSSNRTLDLPVYVPTPNEEAQNPLSSGNESTRNEWQGGTEFSAPSNDTPHPVSIGGTPNPAERTEPTHILSSSTKGQRFHLHRIIFLQAKEFATMLFRGSAHMIHTVRLLRTKTGRFSRDVLIS